jgi:hypothetical protein
MKTDRYYKGDIVMFDHRGATVYMEVEEVRRGCVRGPQTDYKGARCLPLKRWRKRINAVQLVSAGAYEGVDGGF